MKLKQGGSFDWLLIGNSLSARIMVAEDALISMIEKTEFSNSY